MLDTKADLTLSIEQNGDVVLSVERDSDSSLDPDEWVWLMFSDGDEPWYQLTLNETAWLRDRLNYLLGE